MRAIRTVGACAVALALCAATTSVATASVYPLTGLPEIGRCVEVAKGTGGFNTSSCIGHDKDGNDERWEWEPGPAGAGNFKMHLSGPIVETVGGGKIGCTQGTLTGHYANGKEVKVTNVLLQGCANIGPNKPCYSNPTAMGTIESTTPLVGKIGFIPNAHNEANPFVGLDLKAEVEGTPLVSFLCGETLGLETVALEGSVIGKILHTNRMLASNGFTYTQVKGKKGHQNPEAFKGGVKDTITEKISPGTSEQAALITGGELANEEVIEFKAKQH